MGFLDDSDSDDDCSTSSSEVETTSGGKVDVSQFVNRKKASLDDYDAFKGADDEEDEVASKMKELLQLREAMGMDKDVNFLAKQAAKEKEAARLKNMTQEERMLEDKEQSGDMMAKIRAKQVELSKKKAEEDAKKAVEEAKESELDMLKRKKKEKKENPGISDL